jgi:hypothetical protein
VSESTVCIDLFLRWLNEAQQRGFHIADSPGGAAVAVDGAIRLAVEVRPLLGKTENTEWLAARDRLEEQIAVAASSPVAIWVPAGAELPAGEPAASEFVELVRQTATKLGPGERTHVPLPVTLFLRKTADSGSVVSTTGGLNPHWARFTGRVNGSFDLDSTRLHRLPEGDEHLDALIEAVVDLSAKLEAGTWAEIETIDAWTVQRLAEEGESTIIAVPASQVRDMGLAVRRNLRRTLGEVVPSLRSSESELAALVLVGYYAHLEDEGATIALRGFSPALYSGVDFLVLVTDGLVKPLIQSPRRVLGSPLNSPYSPR